MANSVHCTFCGKSSHETEVMFAGPWPVFICNECVEQAFAEILRIIEDRQAADTLFKNIRRCAFCQPEPLALSR